jgi:hypothetical protein
MSPVSGLIYLLSHLCVIWSGRLVESPLNRPAQTSRFIDAWAPDWEIERRPNHY